MRVRNVLQRRWQSLNNCEDCKYYEHEDIDDGYVCVNSDSDYCADWVEPDYGCVDFEERDVF